MKNLIALALIIPSLVACGKPSTLEVTQQNITEASTLLTEREANGFSSALKEACEESKESCEKASTIINKDLVVRQEAFNKATAELEQILEENKGKLSDERIEELRVSFVKESTTLAQREAAVSGLKLVVLTSLLTGN